MCIYAEAEITDLTAHSWWLAVTQHGFQRGSFPGAQQSEVVIVRESTGENPKGGMP